MNSNIPSDAYVIIIGAMRSGTTSLFHYLSQHPEICPSNVKEPEFFSENTWHKLKNLTKYEDLWEFDSTKHKYVLEASTGYTLCPFETGVPERMLKYGINPKLIYIIRNPFDRIISEYNVKREKYGWTISCTNKNVISKSNYYLQLEQYAKHFPLDQILILDYDELRSDPKNLLNRIFTFLSIQKHYPESFERVNSSKPYSNLELKLLSLGLSKLIPKSLKHFVFKTKKLVLSKISTDASKKTLTENERKFIYTELKYDMSLLKQKYGIDVSKWGFNDS